MLTTAFQEPGALDRVVPDSLGDIGQAVGRDPSFDDDVAARTIDFAQMMSPKVPPALRRFEAPHPAHVEAPAIDRLAALLGRQVSA